MVQVRDGRIYTGTMAKEVNMNGQKAKSARLEERFNVSEEVVGMRVD